MHDQAENLRKKLANAKSSIQAKTIAIVSGKGGVGKSNVAINFSLELLKSGKKVLIFDLDVGMGNIHILLGIQPKYTISNMFTNKLPICDIIEAGPNGLSFIAGGSGLSDLFTMTQDDSDYFFSQYEELLHLYDYIIFDMGAGATKDSLSFILAADECIIVTTPEPTSITDAYGMIKHIVNNHGTMQMYVIMNRAMSEKSGLKALADFQKIVKNFLEIDVKLMGILPDDKIVMKAVMRQTPYTIFNERASVSKAMRQIAENYLIRSNQLNKLEPFSFLGKLKQLMIER